MVSSMTAFASRKYTIPQGILRWDVKSVNQRYFEASIKLPEIFQELEHQLRDHLRRKINRGKLFCHLQYEDSLGSTIELDIHFPLLDSLIKTCCSVDKRLKNAAAISSLDLLKWPQVIKNSTPNLTIIYPEIIKLFFETVQDFMQERIREGLELKIFIEQRLNMMNDILKKIRDRLPEVVFLYRERLMQRMLDMQIQADTNRLEQEMVFIAQKTDIAEELDRLDIHLQAVRTLLQTGGVIGRHLDFLSQELNREANTLASKSIDALLTQEIVELKVLIEQIREQVQNIE